MGKGPRVGKEPLQTSQAQLLPQMWDNRVISVSKQATWCLQVKRGS